MRKTTPRKKRVADPGAPAKQTITIRLDEDVLAQFRRSGPGYQTRINQVLRAHVRHSLTGCTTACDDASPTLRSHEIRRATPP
jgi:hypothetical protein